MYYQTTVCVAEMFGAICVMMLAVIRFPRNLTLILTLNLTLTLTLTLTRSTATWMATKRLREQR